MKKSKTLIKYFNKIMSSKIDERNSNSLKDSLEFNLLTKNRWKTLLILKI